MASPPTRASGPFRPTQLGRWEVIAKIAGGGMSAVYLGRRLGAHLGADLDVTAVTRAAFGASASPASPADQSQRHVVALKIVRHDVAKDPQLVRMFLEEGKLLARLVHPNIVRTLEVGSDAEQDFIAMELMLGKTFAAIHDALVARGVRLNPEIAAWTAARIADALHYAHELTDEAGKPLALVHRDVNPANVFATFDGEVKLFDFGLAKVTAGDVSGSQMLAGKLSYLSPEQIMQMPLDRRSDIFSLGTTLWELLTSRRLFRRDTDVDTVRAVQLGPIPDPRTVAPEIPEELARIARTALERNREHRYPSAAHLSRELDTFVLARSSPADVIARLAKLVDTLFPGEQKRQSGWLKPAISSSSSRSMNAVATTPRPGSVSSASRPVPPGPRHDSREMTAVMPSAPPVPSSRESLGPNTLPDGLAAAPTLRDGIASVAPSQRAASSGPRDGIPTGSVSPATMRGAPVRPGAAGPPSSVTARDGIPAARPPVSPLRPGPPSGTSWPAQRPGASAPPAPPALPRRFPTPPPGSRTETQVMPPAPDSSRTEIQRFAPTIETPAVTGTSVSTRPNADDRDSTPSMKPATPTFSAANAGLKPKRPPIPLPSRASQPPKAPSSRKAVAEPPDSEPTQVDMQRPRDPRDPRKR